jgi:hypothetical protein
MGINRNVCLPWSHASRNSGSAALEYLLVTIFSTVVGLTLLGVSSSIVREKLEAAQDEIGIDMDDISFNPFDGNKR